MFEVVIFTQDNGFVSSLTNTGTVDPDQTVSTTSHVYYSCTSLQNCMQSSSHSC